MTNRKEFKKKLKEISDIDAEAKYIFRGEEKNYGEISSTLYRHYQRVFERISDTYPGVKISFLLAIEKSIVEAARSHFSPSTSNIEILTELQHYGGKTALIDFTRNIHIALFFACDGSLDEDGRIILFDTSGIKVKKEIRYDDESECKVIDPVSKQLRVAFQSSTFVHAAKGFIEPEECESIEIPKKLKREFLNYLRKNFDIKKRTAYNDIHGFIYNMREHTDAEEKFYSGINRQLEKKFKKAIKCYDETLELDPFRVSAYINRGNLKLELKKPKEAVKDFDQAIRADPSRATAYLCRGEAQLELKKPKEAVKDFDQAIELDPHNAEVYLIRGCAELELKKPRKAIRDYNKAIELKPEFARAYRCRGLAKLKLKKPKVEEAIEDFDQAIEIKPKYARAYFNRAEAKHCYQDNLKGAKKDYERAVELKPDYPEAHKNLGKVKSDLSKRQKTIKQK